MPEQLTRRWSGTAEDDTEETFPGMVTGVSDRFKICVAWVAGDGTLPSLSRPRLTGGFDPKETFPGPVAGLSNRFALNSCRKAAVDTCSPSLR